MGALNFLGGIIMNINGVEYKSRINCKNLIEYFDIKTKIEKSEVENGGLIAKDHISIKEFLVKIFDNLTIEILEENDVAENIGYFLSLEIKIEKIIREESINKSSQDEIKIKLGDKIYEQYYVKGKIAEIYFDIKKKINENEGNIVADYKIAKEFLITLFDNQFGINELEEADVIEVMSNFYSLYNKINNRIIKKNR